ncbi:MAG: metal-sensitive transcriptional regulator [Deltaproteobacteria bacterium]|nr:metal-sensitive transcriptional regulator [Deltaproteobacteria bacterium]
MGKKKATACCGQCPDSSEHPDHGKELHRVNRISGQLEGVRRMIVEREYCPKIIMQAHAARAALKSLEGVILKRHLESCVKEALTSSDSEKAERKMAELIELFRST